MSQENVEIVRAAYADADPLESFASRIAPDAEFDFTAAYPDGPILHGPDEMRRFREAGPWADIHFDPERFFDVDDERVLVFIRFTSRGRGSGAPAQQRAAHEFTIRKGLLVRFKVYLDRAQALEAAGLRE
jgi:hypothetical protein